MSIDAKRRVPPTVTATAKRRLDLFRCCLMPCVARCLPCQTAKKSCLYLSPSGHNPRSSRTDRGTDRRQHSDNTDSLACQPWVGKNRMWRLMPENENDASHWTLRTHNWIPWPWPPGRLIWRHESAIPATAGLLVCIVVSVISPFFVSIFVYIFVFVNDVHAGYFRWRTFSFSF